MVQIDCRLVKIPCFFGWSVVFYGDPYPLHFYKSLILIVKIKIILFGTSIAIKRATRREEVFGENIQEVNRRK